MIFHPLLALASLFYRIGLFWDRAVKTRKAKKLSRPVISVGNITMGGTGKTPVLIRLVSDLAVRQISPGVLTRGYQGVTKGASGSSVLGVPGAAVSGDFSDEVSLMLEKNADVPIGVGADRAASADKILNKKDVDVFVLDDGFQHWLLRRDMDIVCLDATNPWGGGHLLPWGQLRESLRSLFRPAVIVITRCELVSEMALEKILFRLGRIAAKSVILQTKFHFELVDQSGNVRSKDDCLVGKPVVAVSAIGNPSSFEENLRKSGAHVKPKRFRDHYSYTEKDCDRIEALAKKTKSLIVITEKDWMKFRLTRWGKGDGVALPIFILRQRLSFVGDSQDRWARMLDRFLEHKIHGKEKK